MPWITTLEAARRSGRCILTIRNWARRYGIGKKIGGRFCIDPVALDRMLTLGNPGDDARG